jgi:predicted DNA-binding transcriptional regulator YafY
MADSDKGTRLLDLYIRFSNGAHLTIGQMMKDYKIDRRTVQRDLEMMRTAGGLDLEYEVARGIRVWALKDRARQIDLRYSIREVMSLFLGRRMFDFLENTLLEDSIEKVYKQIEDKLKDSTDRLRAATLSKKIYVIHEGPKKLKAKSREVLDTCLDGLLRDEKLSIRYTSNTGEVSLYTIRPYTLTAYKRGLYLVAFVEEKDMPSVFSLERIERAQRCAGAKFVYPEHFDPEAFFQDALFITIGKPEPVEIVFAAEMQSFIEIRKFHKTQKLTTMKDGRIYMSMKVPINFETINFVLSFGPYAEVTKPKSLRESVRDSLKQALKQYL